ncbi:Ankyrin repeat-containing protein [Oryctes borbonicus]|uniref:Ankyrin repeat-containing protein n=1 Tax=Oryctes borbonicus TaxID=1629725 RepID=A0A0T6BEG0_9SCAR|nr:Ankyrin repeat-containing protein [Oryctes borbonicus]
MQCGPRGENKTPLHLSAEHGYTSNVTTLLQLGGSMLIRDINGMTPSDLADKAGHTECISILKEAADAREKAKLDIHAALRDSCGQGDVSSVQQLVASLSKDAELIVNMAPSGANTLLFTACQTGNKEIVKILLEHGADGRFHPVTKYSPLHIACYHGHRDIVEMLLLRFPELVQQHTVERWLPIHASCINGHVAVLELLFQFPYNKHILKKFRDSSGQWEYYMPYDINERDATGQNILYMACLLGNKKLLDVILKFRVRATRIFPDEDITPSSESNPVVSPTKRRISNGIQSLMSKLNLSRETSVENDYDQVSVICPLRIDMYCNNNTETALHAAVKGKHYDITIAVLNAGANPNLIIKAYLDYNESMSCYSVEDDVNTGQSTALVEACKNRDVPLVDLLLRSGARDDDCKALSATVQNKDETLTAKLLSIKAHPDPEYKINKKAMTDNIHSSHFSLFSGMSNLTYSTIFPNTPAMINWHNQRCNLSQIRTQWLIDASLHLNHRLKQNPRSYDIALYAITRLDVSNNSLTFIPLAVFQLYSLRYLNIAQNKIEKLPIPAESPVKKTHRRKSISTKELNYNCPVLEELYLQDNRLDHIPEAIFRLPNLVTLVVANNKLQYLPYNMWLAPKLKELNASFNFLKELPISPVENTKDDCDKISVSSSDSQLSSHTEIDLDNDGCSDVEADPKQDDGVFPVRYKKKDRTLVQLDVNKHHIWCKSIDVTEQILHSDESVTEKSSQLSALNLAHNLFTSIPVVLPCLAVNLTRLNMAFNSLRSMSHITSYPSSLKQLDLSHNQITVWPSLPQVEAQDMMEVANVTCYATSTSMSRDKLPIIGVRRQNTRSVRNTVLHTVCSHRRHLRLDNLRTLILADNQLARIQLSTDDDGDLSSTEDEDSDRNTFSGKARLMFPNLSMLDISNNNLREIPYNIYELNNLSVLNISGNLGK